MLVDNALGRTSHLEAESWREVPPRRCLGIALLRRLLICSSSRGQSIWGRIAVKLVMYGHSVYQKVDHSVSNVPACLNRG
jgi:hypothetical protein